MADTTGTPTYDTPTVLPMPAEEGYGSLEYFKDQIKAAFAKLDDYKPGWDRNVQSYLAKTLDKAPTSDKVVVPLDFANVESKKSDLFFQSPEIQLTAKQPDLEQAVSVFQSVINHELGPDGVDALGMMQEVLFDALCPSGLMVSKIGYEAFTDGTVPVPTGEMQDDPNAPPQPGAVLNLQPTPQVPVTQDVPNVVYERYFWRRISPAKMIIPESFRGGNYDRSPFLGFEFEDDWSVIKTRYNLDDTYDAKFTSDADERVLKSERVSATSGSDQRVKGWEIWYYAYCFDPNVKHPEAMRLLVILDGIDDPVRHEDSPFQKWVTDPNQKQKLMGMKGNPIHIGAMRYVSDTAYPPSETTISRAPVDELSKSRTQMIEQRDRNKQMRIVDLARIGGPEGLAKVKEGIQQGIIPLPSASENDPPIFPVGEAHFPQENFEFNGIIKQDVQEVWALGANQNGVETNEKKTATEINTIERNSSARLESERRRVLDYYIRGTRKLGALIQMFSDDTKYVEIVGSDGVAQLQPWNKDAVQGEFAYSAKPNSAIHVDAAEDLNNALKSYELLAKDPHVNRVELLTQIARKGNYDATKLIIPQLPERQPDPPNLSFRFQGADLDPTTPHFQIILAIMQQAGYQIPPELIQQAQQHAAMQAQVMAHGLGAPAPGTGTPPLVGPPLGPPGALPAVPPPPQIEHGGPADKMSRLNKRRAEEGGHGVQ